MVANLHSVDPVLRLDERQVRKTSIAAAQKFQQRPGEKDTTIVFWNHTRMLVILLSTVALTFVMANSLIFNFTVICMVEPGEESLLYNETQPGALQPDFIYTAGERSWLFSAVAIGTLLGTLPITHLTSRFGIRITFTVYGVISALSTLLTPLCVSMGMPFVFAMRVLQGVGVTTSWPAMGAIAAEWAPIAQAGMAVAWLSCHLQLGAVLTMPLSGLLCNSDMGWPAAYYLQGLLTLACFALFYWFYTDSPAEHKNVSQRELEQIQEDKVIRVMEEGESENIPYREIFTDKVVLGILCSSFGGNFGFQTFLQYGPVYLNKVLKFDVRNTGFAAALPYLLAIAVKFVAGPCSDRIPGLSSRALLILFASVSQFAMSAAYLALAFLPAGQAQLAQLCFTAAVVFSGLNCVGTIKCTQLISGRFVHFLMAINSFSNSVIILALPGVVSLIAPDDTREQWARLFVFVCVLVVAVTIVFDVTAQSELRPWAGSRASSRRSTVPNERLDGSEAGEKEKVVEVKDKAKAEVKEPKDKVKEEVKKEEKEKKQSPAHFDIDARSLADLSAVERVLREKRRSVQGGQPPSARRLSLLSLPKGFA